MLGILGGGRLQAKTGTRKVVLAGGLLLALGMLATSFIHSSVPWLIYITYGIIGGFGVGMAYNAIITSAQKWFPHKRGLATGVSVCAFGFSTVIFAPLVETMVGGIGVVSTFRTLALAFCAVTLLLFSFIRLPESGAQQAASATLLAKRQYTTSEILRTRTFYYITLSLMFGTAAYFILNPSFKTLSMERGLAASAGTALVMLTGIANALGRLVVPLLSDRLGRPWAAFSILAATAACALLLPFVSGVFLMATVAVIAFCYGGYSGLYPLLTADAFGIQNVGSNYGAVMVGFALSALFFPMLVNALDALTARFIVLAVLAAVGAALVLPLRASQDP